MEASPRKIKYFKYGEKYHVKSECPTLERKNNHFKGKKDKMPKKAYVAWDDYEICSSSDKEHANLALITTHNSDDDDGEVSYDNSLYNNGAQGAIDEVLNECKILYRTISSQKKIISPLEEKFKTIEKEFKDEKDKMISDQKQNFVCNNCESLSFQIVQLKRVLEIYEKGQVLL